jgi:hypothetical protein
LADEHVVLSDTSRQYPRDPKDRDPLTRPIVTLRLTMLTVRRNELESTTIRRQAVVNIIKSVIMQLDACTLQQHVFEGGLGGLGGGGIKLAAITWL